MPQIPSGISVIVLNSVAKPRDTLSRGMQHLDDSPVNALQKHGFSYHLGRHEGNDEVLILCTVSNASVIRQASSETAVDGACRSYVKLDCTNHIKSAEHTIDCRFIRLKR